MDELELVHALSRLEGFRLHGRGALLQLAAALLQARDVGPQAPRLARRHLLQVRLGLHLPAPRRQPRLRVADLQPHIVQVLRQHPRVLLILVHLDLCALQLRLQGLHAQEAE